MRAAVLAVLGGAPPPFDCSVKGTTLRWWPIAHTDADLARWHSLYADLYGGDVRLARLDNGRLDAHLPVDVVFTIDLDDTAAAE